MMDERCLWICAQKAFGAGSRKPSLLCRRFGSLSAFFAAGPAVWSEMTFLSEKEIAVLRHFNEQQATALLQYAQSVGQQVLTPADEDYPPALRPFEDAPAVLFAQGDLSLLHAELSIAIVGTRKASEEGKQTAKMLASQLCRQGAAVISGGALGIDAAAHYGALEARGRTICILGCGIGYPYLVQNEKMRREIVRRGGLLLSEYPPDGGVQRGNFPVRNRLISGLSRGVLVIEAGSKSGSLITARLAAEQGKDVFAVPAGILNPNGAGVNALIKDGAKPVTCAEDILEEYRGITRPVFRTPEKPAPAAQSSEEKPALDGFSKEAILFYYALSTEPRHITEICAETSLSIQQALSAATELELMGFIQSFSGRRYAKE